MLMKIRDSNCCELLLPSKLKPVGFLLILPGLFLLLLRFYFEIKPDVFNIKVFAFYSTYLETKLFSIIENHITEELGGLFLFIGLALINLSKEKNEKIEYNEYRLKAFILTFFATYIFLITSTLFVFGIAFIKIILIGLAAQSIFYYLVFRFLIYSNSKS